LGEGSGGSEDELEEETDEESDEDFEELLRL
jgi:hypothetical protein